MLRVQARALDRALFKVSGCRLQHLKQGHGLDERGDIK
jgi:hypothetical protein